MPRIYKRRFDWELARNLYEQGSTIREIANQVGVSWAAVQRVVVPGVLQREIVYQQVWQQGGVCGECGGPMNKASQRQGHRCRACATKARTMNVREDTLRCQKCRQWKPDAEFPSNRIMLVRRGRHALCRPCNTEEKRAWRQRHPERARATDRAAYERRRA